MSEEEIDDLFDRLSRELEGVPWFILIAPDGSRRGQPTLRATAADMDDPAKREFMDNLLQRVSGVMDGVERFQVRRVPWN